MASRAPRQLTMADTLHRPFVSAHGTSMVSPDDRRLRVAAAAPPQPPPMPSIAKESPESRAQSRARLAALRVEIATV
jgi:hypothetical protein